MLNDGTETLPQQAARLANEALTLLDPSLDPYNPTDAQAAASPFVFPSQGLEAGFAAMAPQGLDLNLAPFRRIQRLSDIADWFATNAPGNTEIAGILATENVIPLYMTEEPLLGDAVNGRQKMILLSATGGDIREWASEANYWPALIHAIQTDPIALVRAQAANTLGVVALPIADLAQLKQAVLVSQASVGASASSQADRTAAAAALTGALVVLTGQIAQTTTAGKAQGGNGLLLPGAPDADHTAPSGDPPQLQGAADYTGYVIAGVGLLLLGGVAIYVRHGHDAPPARRRKRR